MDVMSGTGQHFKNKLHTSALKNDTLTVFFNNQIEIVEGLFHIFMFRHGLWLLVNGGVTFQIANSWPS